MSCSSNPKNTPHTCIRIVQLNGPCFYVSPLTLWVDLFLLEILIDGAEALFIMNLNFAQQTSVITPCTKCYLGTRGSENMVTRLEYLQSYRNK